MAIQGVKTRLKKAIQSCKCEVEVDPILLIIPELPAASSTAIATARSVQIESTTPSPHEWKDDYRAFAKKYAKSPYYQREARIVEPFWTEACSEALRKANEKYRSPCWVYITNEIIRVLPHEQLEELKRRFKENGIPSYDTWHNAIMRYAMAKSMELG